MFRAEALRALAREHQSVLANLVQIEVALNLRFRGLEDAVRALVLAVAAGEPLLLVGPPGTAKSRLIRVFCSLVGVLDPQELDRRTEAYFEYLLTPFTEPGELFGFYDIAQAMHKDNPQVVRQDQGMMQKARIVYLDEIFNGSSAILNSILAFLNERKFHDRGQVLPVAMESFFGATNLVPDAPELRAIFDRFVLRCRVHNVEETPDAIGALLQTGWVETYGQHGQVTVYPYLMSQLQRMRQSIAAQTNARTLVPDPRHAFHRELTRRVAHARLYKLSEVSNRRIVKMSYIMLIHRLYRAVYDREVETKARIEMELPELMLFRRYFLDRDNDPLAEQME